MVSRTLLERARRALPVSAKQKYVTQLPRYQEFLENNEFEVALDKLEELAPCPVPWVIFEGPRKSG